MRATRQPIPVLRAATGRRSLAALIAIAASLTLPSATPAMGPHSSGLMPHLSPFVLGQDPTKKKIGEAKNKNKNKTTDKVTKKDAAGVDPALLRDKTALPEGYRIPPEPLPDLHIDKPIAFPTKPDATIAKENPDLAKKWRDHQDKFRKYTALLRRGNIQDARADKDLLRYGITYRLALLTQRSILFPSDEDRDKVAKSEKKKPDAPPTIEKLRDDILSDLADTNAFNDDMSVRDAFIDILCEEAPKLLDNNFYVRFSIAEILSNINNRDVNHPKGGPEEPGFKAVKALLDLVNDPKQHPLYKLHPVQALARICRHKNCKPEDRFAIIEGLTKQMTAAKKLPEWYGMRVAESLGQLGDPNDRARQPVVVEALVSVLKDTEYKHRVRVQAAHSLGRVPLEGYKKSDEIAVEILRFASQMAQEYEKDQKNPRWKLYFAWLYLAFQPMNDVEKNEKKGLLGQVESKPALAGTKTAVTEAYQLFLPLAQNILGGKAQTPVPDQLRKIKTWLDARGKGPGAPVANAKP